MKRNVLRESLRLKRERLIVGERRREREREREVWNVQLIKDGEGEAVDDQCRCTVRRH
jgi:hypothetical protein